MVHLAVAATKPRITLAVIVVWTSNAHTMRHAGLIVASVLGATCEHALSHSTTVTHRHAVAATSHTDTCHLDNLGDSSNI